MKMKRYGITSMLCGAALFFGAVNATNVSSVQDSNKLGGGVTRTSMLELPLIEEEHIERTESLSYSFQHGESSIDLTQGAVIGFADESAFGKAKNLAQLVSRVKNTNKINGVSALFLAYWSDIRVIGDGNSNPYINNVMNYLDDYATFYAWSNEDLIPCTVSLDGSYVSLIPLQQKVMQCKGNVYYRNLNEDISANIEYSAVLDLFKNVVGKPAESFLSLKEPILALWDKNTEENTDKFFNSELTAYCYKKLGIISQDINCSNVIPAELSSAAGSHDVLNGLAGSDTLLNTFKYDDPLTTECCGMFKNLIKKIKK